MMRSDRPTDQRRVSVGGPALHVATITAAERRLAISSQPTPGYAGATESFITEEKVLCESFPRVFTG
jgi:hypothetical protein